MLQISKDESKAITNAKVICMFGVIFIHAAIKMYADCSVIVNFYYDFLTRILVSFAVPGFFLCSGFLFYLNYNGIGSYVKKLKSRIRGLLIPYLFWISLTLLVTWFIQDGLGMSRFFGAGNMKLIHDFSMVDICQSYWNVRDGSPFLSTMWFLRDLMVCVALAPGFFCILRLGILSIMFLAFFLVLSLSGCSFANISFSSIMYFIMGGYLSINRINPFVIIRKNRKYLYVVTLLLLICFSFVYTEDNHLQGVLYRAIMIAYNIMMILTVLSISLDLGMNKIGIRIGMLGIPSYFIYLAHEPYMGYLLQLTLKILSNYPCLFLIAKILIPIFYPIFIIGLFYKIFKLMKKYVPRLLSVAVGGKI